jgi:hypothetical protein
MLGRKLGIGVTLATAAVVLSGCVVFKSAPSAKQKSGSVVITVKACASQSSGTPAGSCTNQGNSKFNAASSPAQDQAFLGFRVPTYAKAPSAFVANTGPSSGGPILKFAFSKSYAGQLQSNAPAPHGQKWVGYWTKYFMYSNSSGQQNFTARPAFGLPKNAKGKFHYQVVLGGRASGVSTPNPSQKVNCMGKLTMYHLNHAKNEAWICVDDSFSFSLTLK